MPAPRASQGTLLLNNIHKAPKAVLPLLKQTVDAVSRGAPWLSTACSECAAGQRPACPPPCPAALRACSWNRPMAPWPQLLLSVQPSKRPTPLAQVARRQHGGPGRRCAVGSAFPLACTAPAYPLAQAAWRTSTAPTAPPGRRATAASASGEARPAFVWVWVGPVPVGWAGGRGREYGRFQLRSPAAGKPHAPQLPCPPQQQRKRATAIKTLQLLPRSGWLAGWLPRPAATRLAPFLQPCFPLLRAAT